MDSSLFLSNYIDLLLVIGYMLLLMSVFALIMVCRHHISKVNSLEEQINYWRQQALTQLHRDDENKKNKKD